MSKAKKIRIDDEARKFHKQWTEKYFFGAHAEKGLCLTCKKSIPAIKEYNLKKHFDKNHKAYRSLVREKRKQKTEKLRKEIFCITVNV